MFDETTSAPHAGAGRPQTGRGRPAGGNGGQTKRRPPCAKQGGLVWVVWVKPLRLAALQEQREAREGESRRGGLGNGRPATTRLDGGSRTAVSE